MNILVLGNFLFDSWSGGSVAANFLAKHYQQQGNHVEIVSFNSVCSRANGENFFGEKYPDYKSGPDKIKIVFSEYLDIYNPFVIPKLKKILKSIRPDVVHIHNVHFDLSAASIALCKSKGIATIITFHEFWPICARFNLADKNWNPCSGPALIKCICCKKYGYPYQIPLPGRMQILKKIISAADFIVTPSEFSSLRLIAYGYPQKSVHTIYNGVDLNIFSPTQQAADSLPLTIIYVGRTSYKKGVTFLIEACQRLYNMGESFRLKIIGNRPINNRILNYPFIDFYDSVKHFDLPQHMKNADIFVQPSLIHETFGLTIAEAMACGLPVIVSAMGGMPEVAAEGGIIIPAGQVETLKDAILKLMRNPELRIALGAKGRMRVEKKFTWTKSAAQYLNLMEEILHSK